MHDSSCPVKSCAKIKQSQFLGEAAKLAQHYPSSPRLVLLNLPCGKTTELCVRNVFTVRSLLHINYPAVKSIPVLSVKTQPQCLLV